MIDAITLSRLAPAELTPSGLELSNDSFTTASAGDFGTMLGRGVQSLNTQLVAADTALRAYAAGDGPTTADLMVTMTEARERLQFAVEVRNRLVDAYQSLTNMQI